MQRYYRIGNLTIEYQGPDFQESAELKAFQLEAANPDMRPDIRCNLQPVERIELPENCANSKANWKRDLEYIINTKDGRISCLTDPDKNIELLVTEAADREAARVHQGLVLNRYANKLGISPILRVLDLPYEILRHGGVFLHASFIEWRGKAILFTAPKQTGKSTQAALWEKYKGAEIINGDRSLLRKAGGRWQAFGSPYCGTSHICKNKAVPIAAIVILGQAKENHLRKAATMEALRALLDGCSYDTWDKEQVIRMMDIANDLIKNLTFWKLDCLPDKSAVELLETIL